MQYLDERKELKKISLSYNIDNSKNLHSQILTIRDNIINSYLNAHKTNAQFIIWQRSRSFFRQTALETLQGKMALCGELSRVIINLLRIQGIDTRRLYLYGLPGTSHVMFEYKNPKDGKWYAVNSWQSSEYIENMTAIPMTIENILLIANKDQLKYKYFSNYPIKIVNFLGYYPYNITYIVSWLMDEILLLKAIISLFFAMIVALFLYFFRKYFSNEK